MRKAINQELTELIISVCARNITVPSSRCVHCVAPFKTETSKTRTHTHTERERIYIYISHTTASWSQQQVAKRRLLGENATKRAACVSVHSGCTTAPVPVLHTTTVLSRDDVAARQSSSDRQMHCMLSACALRICNLMNGVCGP